MSQLRLVWNSTDSEILSPSTKKKPAKCVRLQTASSASRSLLKRLEKLHTTNPTAFAVIERWVDQTLADTRPCIQGALLE